MRLTYWALPGSAGQLSKARVSRPQADGVLSGGKGPGDYSNNTDMGRAPESLLTEWFPGTYHGQGGRCERERVGQALPPGTCIGLAATRQSVSQHACE